MLRSFDQLLRVERVPGLDKPRSPYMFTAFLDKGKIASGKTLVFAADIAVSSTDFEIDNVLFFDKTIPGEYLFRHNIVVRVTLGKDGIRPRYVLCDEDWGETSGGRGFEKDELGYYIPLSSRKGFRGKLRFTLQEWNVAD